MGTTYARAQHAHGAVSNNISRSPRGRACQRHLVQLQGQMLAESDLTQFVPRYYGAYASSVEGEYAILRKTYRMCLAAGGTAWGYRAHERVSDKA